MARYLCLHGHFYQPPRENPWTEEIEEQPSARPHHDWNARIAAECYGPNGAARLFDGSGRIARIVNNYAQMSFNFGPTLLSWLERQAPDVYAAVLAADVAGRQRFAGHGGAMAQAYNHMIMPLANRRDKETQVLWGLRDFAHRFGRPAAGMWLPETAVDLETLEVMAAHGVGFTILEPHQARRVRGLSQGSLAMPVVSLDGGSGGSDESRGAGGVDPGGYGAGVGAAGVGGGGVGIGGGGRRPAADAVAPGPRHWREVTGGGIDTTRPYVVRLPSGRRISVFFYDGPIARAVAFERLLHSGEAFAWRLVAAAPGDGHDRLVNVATDGETYGHHHRFGEMALAFALQQIEASGAAIVTNYGEYLAAHPPVDQVEVVDNSSWSCVHGVDRWREDCGCRIGGDPDWNQAWRAPLRQALDELRDGIAPLWESAAAQYFAEPWRARDDSVQLLLDRSEAARDRFFEHHASGPTPSGERRVRALSLLEMQRHALLMYTSCGWFFDDIGGLEAVQVLRYAARAAQLADQHFGGEAEAALRRHLGWARSNDRRVGTGRDLYDRQVRPSRRTRRQVAAHFALRAVLLGEGGEQEEDATPDRLEGHTIVRDGSVPGREGATGRGRWVAGRLVVESPSTGARQSFDYCALSDGLGLVRAGVAEAGGATRPGSPGGNDGSDGDDGKDGIDGKDGNGGNGGGDGIGATDGLVANAANAAVAAIEAIGEAFQGGDGMAAAALLEQCFGDAACGLDALPAEGRRRLLQGVERQAAARMEAALRAVLSADEPLLRRLGHAGHAADGAEDAEGTESAESAEGAQVARGAGAEPLDPVLAAVAEAGEEGGAHALLRGGRDLLLNAELDRAFADPGSDLGRIEGLLAAAKSGGTRLDAALGAGLATALERLLDLALAQGAQAAEIAPLERAVGLARIAAAAPFRVDLWRAQNLCHQLREAEPSSAMGEAGPPRKDQAASGRAALLRELAGLLSIAI